MDCIYTAYASYLHWLDEPTTWRDYMLYRWLKTATHGPRNQQTLGGVVPWMLTLLGRRHGYPGVIGEWRLCEPIMYIRQTNSRLSRSIIRNVSLGEEVERITLAPAIYLDLSIQHALFAESVPTSGSIIAAYQFLKRR